MANRLNIGTRIKLYRLFRKKYKPKGTYTIANITPTMLLLRKDIGYCETVTLLDLRQGFYKICLESGKELEFRPLSDIKGMDEIGSEMCRKLDERVI
jgi:hypothetical protein